MDSIMVKNKVFTAEHTCMQKDCKTSVEKKGMYCSKHVVVEASNVKASKATLSETVENIRKALFDKPHAEESATGTAPDKGEKDSTSYTERAKDAMSGMSDKAKAAYDKAKAAAPKADTTKKEGSFMNKVKDVFGKVTGTAWDAAKYAAKKVGGFVKKHAAQAGLALLCVGAVSPLVSGMMMAVIAGTGLYAAVHGIYALVANRYMDKEITVAQYGNTALAGFLYAAAATFTFMYVVPFTLYVVYTATVYAYAYGNVLAFFIMA
jgi:hypothetical protein